MIPTTVFLVEVPQQQTRKKVQALSSREVEFQGHGARCGHVACETVPRNHSEWNRRLLRGDFVRFGSESTMSVIFHRKPPFEFPEF